MSSKSGEATKTMKAMKAMKARVLDDADLDGIAGGNRPWYLGRYHCAVAIRRS